MADQAGATIATRFTRLDQLILGKANDSLSKKHLAHRDSLLDVLFALYEECNVDHYRRNRHISSFVDKFKSIMIELKSLRLNLKDFELKKIIGRGHFGEVQLVREKASGDIYAMKVLHKQETFSQQNVAFYEEERDIMAKSTSPWLTKLQYAFQDDQNLYLVMEFHPGGDMISLLEKYDNVLPDEMCQFYLAELVLAIHSLHSMGYVHRDIKPGNILIDRTGHIKLADFGSSSKLNDQKQVTSSMPVGTPDYVAPEVLTALNGESSSSKRYGVECDWWSLGVVAYEMAFGSTPFADEKVLVTYNNVMNFQNSLTFPPEASEVSDKLIDLIEKLLTDSVSRLGYDELINHSLFTSINWNEIQHTCPPFVPIVSSVDDTSNFDEFEPENRTFMRELKAKKEFSGKNLPFVGFTYTSSFQAPLDKSSSADGSITLSPSSSLTEVDSNLRSCKLRSLEKELAQMIRLEKTLRIELDKLNVSQVAKDGDIESVRAENLVLEQAVSHLQAELKEAKQLLEYEREHRIIMEKKAVQVVRCMKTKQRASSSRLLAKSQEYHKQEGEKLTLEEQLDNAMVKMDELLNEKSELVEDLEETKHLLFECQQKLKEQEQLLLLTSNESSNTSQSSVNISSSINGEQGNIPSKLVSKLEKKNVQLEQELETALHAKQEAEKQVSALKEANGKLKKKLGHIKKDNIEASSRDQGEKVVNSVEKNEKELESKYVMIEEMQQKLLSDAETNAVLKKKVQDFENDLQSHSNAKKSMDMKVKELENRILTMAKGSNENSSSEADQLQENPILWEKKVKSINERQTQILLTSDLKQENEYFKSKNAQLLEEISNLKTEMKSIENLKKQLKEKEDALSEAKLDLRVATRKEQQSESVTSSLRERNKELREKLKASEEMVSVKTKIEDDLREKLCSLEGDISRLKDEINQIEKSREIEKAKLEERIKTLKDTWESSKDVNQKFAKTQGQYEEILRQNADLVRENEEKEKKVNEYVQENKTLKAELLKRKEDCSKYQRINGILKTACLEIEEDMDEFKIIVEKRESVIAELTSDMETLQVEMRKLKEDLKNANTNVESAEKHKKELLTHINELSAELNSQSELHDTEIQDLQDSLTHFKKLVNELEVQTSQLQKQLSLKDGDTKCFTAKISTLESQLFDIKEEAACHITQISSLKKSNLKLTQELEDALEYLKNAKMSMGELDNELESEKAKHNHEKVKLQETISQQTKLIDFLQSKTENMEKKKKPMAARLFGKKENNPPQMLPPRDVERLLETERSRCRRLQDQLSQARMEREVMRKEISALTKSSTANAEIPVSPLSRAMHSAITFSPNADKDTPALSSKELLKSIIKPPGMKHKIPHRFTEVMCMRSTKCCACLDSIHFGRQVEKCQECGIMSHPKCATSLPSTCGLPSGFMDHFKTAVQDSSSSNGTGNTAARPEGWIKIPKSSKQGWDRRYLRLIGEVLYIFEDAEETSENQALCEFDFSSGEAKLVVTSAVSATELPYAATSDLPYVLKIETFPYTTCWPQRSLYIMTSNFNDKKMWVSILEHLAEKNLSEMDGLRKNKLVGRTLWTLKSEKLIDPLCTTVFDQNVILLGAVEGLFVLSVVNRFTCSLQEKIGKFSYVYQVTCMRSIGIMVLIHDEDRKLSLAQLSDVQSNMSKSSKHLIALKQVTDVNDCHLFAVEETRNVTAPYICIASADSVVLCQWDSTSRIFIPKKLIKASEPCSCILFTQQSIIFGANIFYELSLGDFNTKKFLDGSDASLAGLVYGASQYRSFPVAVFQVSPNRQNEEYLLCFHEMGVFVNSEGRRTRPEDMKWSRLPLSFAYQSPYLFITHFTSVEVIEIPPQNISEPGIRACMLVKNPQFMGMAHFPKSILVSSSQNGAVELVAVDASSIGLSDFQQTTSDDSSVELASSAKESGEENDAVDLDFSFSTSINSTEEQTDDVSLSSKSPLYSTESVSSKS